METSSLPRSPTDGSSRTGSTWRRDERSERSVRDKIALFTNDTPSTNHKSSQIIATNQNDAKSGVGKTFSYSVDNLAVNSSPKLASKLQVSARTEPRTAVHRPLDYSSLSERSRSLLDVTKTKRHSLLQQRKDPNDPDPATKRRSLSKLRGLVIPADPDAKSNKPIVDLPEIISKDSILVQGKVNLTLTRSDPLRISQNSINSTSTADETENQKRSTVSFKSWKSTVTSTIPKYSPAFKRKELTVSKLQNDPAEKEPNFSVPPADPELENSVPSHREEGSDTDSAVSSSRSSFSTSGSPVPSTGKDDDVPDDSAGSPRVLKPQSVEALNRKNVLQSARFSSGGTEEPNPVPNPVPVPNPRASEEVISMSPLSLSPIRSRKGSLDFEQILKRFSDAEKPDKSPSRRCADRKIPETPTTDPKAAFINEVIEDVADPSAFAAYTKDLQTISTPVKIQEASIVSVPTPLPRRSIAEPVKQDWKKMPSKAAPCAREEQNSFRALAERWQAITEGPASPSGTLRKSEAPTPAVRRTVVSEKPQPVEVETHEVKTTSRASNNVLEIRKAFERVRGELETESNLGSVHQNAASDEPDGSAAKNLPGYPHSIFTPISFSTYSCSGFHARMSSLDSTTSEDNSLSLTGSLGHYGVGAKDNYGSITSLASSTSLISPQELQQLIEEANQSLEESGTPSHEIVVVVLHRGEAGPASLGLGITLAGGADYETKEITVHKVIAGSVADKDGRIQKGDRVLSINGRSLKGVTHREALSILKAPRPEVVFVLSRNRSVTPQEGTAEERESGAAVQISVHSRHNSHVTSNRPPRILESPLDNPIIDTDERKGPCTTVILVKDGAGLGFSLEGGRDSPLGDKPLTVKKIFTGGAASKNGVLQVGDEIISFNGCDVTGMSRIEAWNFMKKLPDGTVTLVIRQNQS